MTSETLNQAIAIMNEINDVKANLAKLDLVKNEINNNCDICLAMDIMQKDDQMKSSHRTFMVSPSAMRIIISAITTEWQERRTNLESKLSSL